MTYPRHIRIFLSSPGDVADERALALRAFERVQYDPLLRGQVTIEAVAWDKPGADTPLLATMTPQEAINEGLPTPSECDIVVVIFWSRMGTPLPGDYTKPDGTRYLSGTEWEYEDAIRAARATGRPLVVVYRRIEDVAFNPRDPQFGQRLEQWQRVEAFFAGFINPDSSIKQGFNTYQSPDDFAAKFETHLKELVKRLLDESERHVKQPPPKPADPLPLWEGSPFPGLRAFTPTDAPIFFGRGAEADSLVKRLSNPASRLIAIVGASGSGKSSLVGAGLLPRLTLNAIEGSKDWMLPAYHVPGKQWSGLRFTPGEVGDNPFMALALKLAPLVNRSAREVSADLEVDPACLNALVEVALIGRPAWAEMVVFLDQFEELFTLVNPARVVPFVKALTAAVTTPRIRVVLTLRADFYANCVEYPDLAVLLEETTYPLAAPGVGALYEMIVRPAERAGLVFEAGLVDRVLRDTGIDPGALALMAYALDELFHASDDQLLTHAEYDALGGVQGAIGKRAENTFRRLEAEVQASLPDVFREICEVDERGVAIRRRAMLKRAARTVAARRLVDALTDARLLVQSAALPQVREQPTEAVVEVAHEALLRSWGRLAAWIDDTQDELRLLRQVRLGADDWQRVGRDKSYLLTGSRLEQAARMLDGGGLSPLQEEYVRTSLSEKEREEIEHQEQQARELRLKQRVTRVLRVLVVVLVIFSIGAVGLALFALDRERGAQAALITSEVNAAQSESLRLAGEADNILQTGGNSETAALLSLRALNTAYTAQADAALAQAVDRLYTLHTFGRQGERQDNMIRIGEMYDALFLPDNRRLVTASMNSALKLWDVETGTLLATLKEGYDENWGFRQLILSPDGSYFLAAEDRMLSLWDTDTTALLRSFDVPLDSSSYAALSPPDGQWLAISSRDGVQVWDVKTGESKHTFSSIDGFDPRAIFSGDGRYLLIFDPYRPNSDGQNDLEVWDVTTGQRVVAYAYSYDYGSIHSIAAFPNAPRFLILGTDGIIRSLDAVTGKILAETSLLTGLTRGTIPIELSPDGRPFVSNIENNEGGLFDPGSMALKVRFSGHTSAITDASFSADGFVMLTGSEDGTARLWDTFSGRSLQTFTEHTMEVLKVGLSADGRYAFSLGWDWLRLWPRGQYFNPQDIHSVSYGGAVRQRFSPDGRFLYSSNDSWGILQEVESGQLFRPNTGESLSRAVFTADGKSLVVRGVEELAWLSVDDPEADPYRHWTIWPSESAASGDPTQDAERRDVASRPFDVSPDGSYVAMVQTNFETYSVYIDLRDAQTGKRLWAFENDLWTILDMAFSPDGGRLAASSYNGRVHIWEVATGELVHTLYGHSGVPYSIAWSPDGTQLATGGGDSLVLVWDTATGQALKALKGHTFNVNSVVWSQDGSKILSASADSTVRLWDAETGETLRVMAGPIHDVQSAVFGPDGKTIYIATREGTRIWDINWRDFVAYACTRVFRDLTNTEWKRYSLPDTPTCPAFGHEAKLLLEAGS